MGVDHSRLKRLELKHGPLLDQQFRARIRPVGTSWRIDEIHVRIEGARKYLYHAIGDAVRSRTEQTEATGVALAAATLNRILGFGQPNNVRIA